MFHFNIPKKGLPTICLKFQQLEDLLSEPTRNPSILSILHIALEFEYVHQKNAEVF